MKTVHVHVMSSDEALVVAFEQWRRLVTLLDAQSMVADGDINYPTRGIAATHLLRGSSSAVDGSIDPEDLADALSAREVDTRNFSQVHLQAMMQLSRDEEDQPHPAWAHRHHLAFKATDEVAYRQLLGLLAEGAGTDGALIHIEGEEP